MRVGDVPTAGQRGAEEGTNLEKGYLVVLGEVENREGRLSRGGRAVAAGKVDCMRRGERGRPMLRWNGTIPDPVFWARAAGRQASQISRRDSVLDGPEQVAKDLLASYRSGRRAEAVPKGRAASVANWPARRIKLATVSGGCAMFAGQQRWASQMALFAVAWSWDPTFLL